MGKLAAVLSCAYPNCAQNPDLAASYLTAGLRSSRHVDILHTSKVPLAKSAFDIPLPYLSEAGALASWHKWLCRQRSIRSAPAYLDNGELVGIYTYNDPFNRGPPTRGGGFFSDTTGVDGVGELDLRLSFGADGYVHGTKACKP